MRTLTFILILSALFGGAVESRSQPGRAKFGFGVLTGGSRLQGDIETSNTGLTYGALLRYAPISFFALSANATYGTVTSGLNAIKSSILNASLSGTIFLLPKSRVRPFVSGGWTNYYYEVKNKHGQKILNSDGTPLSRWQNAFQVGAGLELFVAQNWALNTMGDYLIAQVDDLDGVVEGTQDRFLRALFGVVYYFGTGSTKEHEQEKAWKRKLGVSLEQLRSDDAEPRTPKVRKGSLNKDELFSDGIYFEPGGTMIQERSRWQLVKVYRFLKANPDEVLELKPLNGLESAKDSVRQFVLARARSVKKYLVDLGVDPERIIIDPN